jgi:hypothetical protein
VHGKTENREWRRKRDEPSEIAHHAGRHHRGHVGAFEQGGDHLQIGNDETNGPGQVSSFKFGINRYTGIVAARQENMEMGQSGLEVECAGAVKQRRADGLGAMPGLDDEIDPRSAQRRRREASSTRCRGRAPRSSSRNICRLRQAKPIAATADMGFVQ